MEGWMMKAFVAGQCFLLPGGERVMTTVYLYPYPEEDDHTYAVTPTGRIFRLDEEFWAHKEAPPSGSAAHSYSKVATALTVDDLVPDPENDLSRPPG
ncbi:MAG: hypothetical protein ACYS0D_04465 [Planctomycetota bacterium]|jgi:hypothetical protein